MADYSSFGNYGLDQPAPQGGDLFNLLQPKQPQPTQGMNQPWQMNYGFTPEDASGFQLDGAPDADGFDFKLPSLQDTGTALKGTGNLAQALLGFKQLSEAKKQAQFQRGMATTNLSNQAKLTNADLADRQQSRVQGSSGGNYASVADYMSKYGVSGAVA